MRLQAGWLYLVAVLDWYARYVVAWALDQTLEWGFVLAAADQALTVGCPTIWNSDQGSHFTSPQYHAPPRFPLHILAVDGGTMLGRDRPLTRPFHA